MLLEGVKEGARPTLTLEPVKTQDSSVSLDVLPSVGQSVTSAERQWLYPLLCALRHVAPHIVPAHHRRLRLFGGGLLPIIAASHSGLYRCLSITH